MNRFFMGMLGAALLVALFTWILGRLSYRRPWVHYLPASFALLVGFHQVVARGAGGVEALARGLLAVLILAGAVGGIITAFAMDFYRRHAAITRAV